MKKILFAPDAAAGLPAKPAAPAAAPVDITADLARIKDIIAAWKTVQPPSGQLQIAIGALAHAFEYANHHLALKPAPAAAKA